MQIYKTPFMLSTLEDVLKLALKGTLASCKSDEAVSIIADFLLHLALSPSDDARKEVKGNARVLDMVEALQSTVSCRPEESGRPEARLVQVRATSMHACSFRAECNMLQCR